MAEVQALHAKGSVCVLQCMRPVKAFQPGLLSGRHLRLSCLLQRLNFACLHCRLAASCHHQLQHGAVKHKVAYDVKLGTTQSWAI